MLQKAQSLRVSFKQAVIHAHTHDMPQNMDMLPYYPSKPCSSLWKAPRSGATCRRPSPRPACSAPPGSSALRLPCLSCAHACVCVSVYACINAVQLLACPCMYVCLHIFHMPCRCSLSACLHLYVFVLTCLRMHARSAKRTHVFTDA
jgi:hypothetical protein